MDRVSTRTKTGSPDGCPISVRLPKEHLCKETLRVRRVIASSVALDAPILLSCPRKYRRLLSSSSKTAVEVTSDSHAKVYNRGMEISNGCPYFADGAS